jgi:subtilisin family serine protease
MEAAQFMLSFSASWCRSSLFALGLLAPAILISPELARAQGAIERVGGHAAAANEVLVKLRQASGISQQQLNASIERTAALVQSDGFQAIDQQGTFRIHSKLFTAEQLINLLGQDPLVESAEPNYMLRTSATVPNDTLFPQQWGMANTGQIVGGQAGVPFADIKATNAWDKTIGSAAIAVGVLDTGIDYNHTDLAANIWTATAPYTIMVGVTPYNCPAGSHGFNAHELNCDPMDNNGHGTHVSGTIGARGNNGTGSSGVNWKTSLVALRMLGQFGTGSEAEATVAIRAAIQLKGLVGGPDIRVLNASWQGEVLSAPMQSAIQDAGLAGILFVAAAGNETDDLEVTPHYPASYNFANIVSVTATDNRDNLATFSNFGVVSVDLAAPGVNILSTVPTNTYTFFSGSSMAAAHVSGAAALVLSACPLLDVTMLKAALLSNTDLLPSLTGKVLTGGRLNVSKAVDSCSPLGVPDFTVSAASNSLSILAPNTTSTTITIAPLNGFNSSVTLSVIGLPAGLTATFGTNPVLTGSGTSLLTLTAAAGTAVGNYPLTITGTGGSRTSSTVVNVAITGQDFTLAAGAISLTIGQSGTASTTTTVAPLFGFTGPVALSIIGGSPAPGVTAVFVPAIIPNANGTATLTFTAAAIAVPGIYTVGIRGVSGLLTHDISLELRVTPTQDFTLSAVPPTVALGAGGSAIATVTSTALFGFSGVIGLNVIGLPPGVTPAFAPPTITGSGTSVLTMTSNGAVSSGTYPITVQGTSGTLARNTTFNLLIVSSLPRITVSAPANIAIGETVPVLLFLSEPAPVGGIDVLLTNSNVSAGSLSQTSIFIPGGQASSSRARITGIASGILTVNASVAAYQSGTANIQVGTGAPTPVAITTAALNSGQTGSPYFQIMQATGGTLPYAWQLISGTLPTGMSLSPAGILGGTPTTTAAAVNLTFKVTDSTGVPQTATRVLSLTITTPPPPPPVIITTAALNVGQTGSLYLQTLQATGGTLPYTWQLMSGTLPTGMSLSTSGILSGIPTTTAAGVNLTFKVTDSTGVPQTATATLPLTVNAAPPPPPPPVGPQITVSAPASIQVGATDRILVFLPGPAANPGVTVNITLSNPLLGSLNQPGTFIPEGQSNTSRPRLTGLAPGNLFATFSAPGYAPTTVMIVITP